MGGRDVVTAQKLKMRMEELNITYDCIASDHWESFIKIFKPNHQGKYHTVGIEGNNCRLRHRIKRAVRRTCCFSKKVLNHIKAFDLGSFTLIMVLYSGVKMSGIHFETPPYILIMLR